jgi:ATP-dependent DNA helicase RecG
MNRLLNGDVGSGKTVVAVISALEILASGYQVAIMAPTEVLARQHFITFCELFKNYNINISLLTNSYKLSCHCERIECHPERSEGSRDSSAPLHYAQNDRKELLDKTKLGKIDLIIGTHALIQKDVKFKNLALVIIDEQHRFGVAQRAAIQQETMDINDGDFGVIPHLLTMTATPIPRTLAISFFGNLDLSIISQMPKNRKPINTKIVKPKEQERVYEFIRNLMSSGRQTFIIFPLIEESKSESMADVKAATQEYERLSKEIFPEFKIGLLHGRLKSKEKEETMEKFKNKQYDILVSTSVVEVGIDIPNATAIIIENAERFGLSQLHQFRGRVGRGQFQSYCFLFTRSDSERLKIMEATNDGFKISERDLELRGPGHLFGILQSGLPDIAMENLTNLKLIKFAREEAAEILSSDPELKKHPLLADALKKFSEKIHLE